MSCSLTLTRDLSRNTRVTTRALRVDSRGFSGPIPRNPSSTRHPRAKGCLRGVGSGVSVHNYSQLAGYVMLGTWKLLQHVHDYSQKSYSKSHLLPCFESEPASVPMKMGCLYQSKRTKRASGKASLTI